MKEFCLHLASQLSETPTEEAERSSLISRVFLECLGKGEEHKVVLWNCC